MEKYRFLILTDSVSLPRTSPEYTPYEVTWPYLLKKSGCDIIHCGIGGATIADIVRQTFYYNEAVLKVDFVIVQCGIVDCAPRFLSKYEQLIIRKIPFIGNAVFKALNKNWVRKLRKITYTRLRDYEKGVQKIHAIYGDKLHFMTIAPAHAEYEKRAAGITRNIYNYNAVLRKNVPVIDMDGIEKFGITDDYHHFNAKGHRYAFEQIQKALKITL